MFAEQELKQLHDYLIAEGFTKTEYGYRKSLAINSKVVVKSWEIVIMPKSHTGMGRAVDRYGLRDHEHPEFVDFLGCIDSTGRPVYGQDCSLVYRRLRSDGKETVDIPCKSGEVFPSVAPFDPNSKHHLLVNDGEYPVRAIVDELLGSVSEMSLPAIE